MRADWTLYQALRSNRYAWLALCSVSLVSLFAIYEHRSFGSDTTAHLAPEIRSLMEVTQTAPQHDIAVIMTKTKKEDVNWLVDLYSDM